MINQICILIMSAMMVSPPVGGEDSEPAAKRSTHVTVKPKHTGPEIKLTGSSTVGPYARAVSGMLLGEVRLVVEDIGTSTGIASLCSARANEADIASASRQVRSGELKSCAQNGVQELIQLEIGMDGVVFAQAEKSEELNLTTRDLYLAIARSVPRSNDECVMVLNRREYWSDVREDLPHRPILLLGPPIGSGTRDMMVEKVIKDGARSFHCLASLEHQSPAFFDAAIDIRVDGPWVDGGESDHAIGHTLHFIPEAIGVFGFSYLNEMKKISTISVDGVLPTYNTIEDKSYPVIRPLYLYAVRDHFNDVPGLFTTFARFGSPDSLNRGGMLAGLGLVVGEYAGIVTVINTQTNERVSVPGGVKALLKPNS